jgi:prepilin peptidase CpaA
MEATLIIAIILSTLMTYVVYSDLRFYIIPNWLCGAVIALYPVMLLLTPEIVDWLDGLMFLGIMFTVGLLIFTLNWMGGGDVKLLAALALWTGWEGAGKEFLIYTVLFGGVLSLLLLLLRFILPMVLAQFMYKPIILPSVVSHGKPVPYGVAIAAAFLLLLWKEFIPGVVL